MWEFFKDKVSEWNPCFTSDGEERFFWDEEVGAHDVETTIVVGGVPERTRLRPLLDRVFASAKEGGGDGKVDLEPVRRLVAALVKTSGRHTMHGKRAPRLGKDPCARGKQECPYCRYGFPKGLVPRCGVCVPPGFLAKGDRVSEWRTNFPRNDALSCAHEPHVLLGNMGNVDWRPMLNLWAVTEYVTKYATKPSSGSRQIGDVLKDAAMEVCKFTPLSEEEQVVRQTLQKFYARTLGERDYHLFEAVHLGLGLPLVYSMMSVLSLNTSGNRSVKTAEQLRAENAGPDTSLVWDSKVQHFDNRLALMRKTCAREETSVRVGREAEVRFMSLYEFVWKYTARAGRLSTSPTTSAFMVTPSFPSDCAFVGHDRHEAFARTCVVAFWRLMPTKERYEAIAKMLGTGAMLDVDADRRRWGGTCFEEEAPHAGSEPSLLDRWLGVQDLVKAFDAGKHQRRECVWVSEDSFSAPQCKIQAVVCDVECGWGLALMEMLLDPLLKLWVPRWLRVQYRVWNKDFKKTVNAAMCDDRSAPRSNRVILERVREALLERAKSDRRRKEEEEARRKEAGKSPPPAPVEGGADEGVESDGGAGGDDGEDPGDLGKDPAAAEGGEDAEQVVIREELPTADDDDDACGGAGDGPGWGDAGAAERASAAGPAPALSTSGLPSSTSRGVALPGQAAVNPPGHRWESFAPRSCVSRLQTLWKRLRGQAVQYDGAVASRSSLDSMQKFFYDILEHKDEERERLELQSKSMSRDRKTVQAGALSKYKPLRIVLTGAAGAGKSRTIRASVQCRRDRRLELNRSHRLFKKEEDAVADADAACLLAAPTGCASFQMKYGARTAHSAFGIGVGFCGPLKNKTSRTFLDRVRRLRAARLFVLDEFSMIGRSFLGKIEYRVQEALRSGERECGAGVSLGGRDTVLSGDPRQAMPVTEEPMYINGPYKGKAKNLPPRRRDGAAAEVPPGTPTVHDFVGRGCMLRDEFDDVVFLRKVHRADRSRACVDPEQRKRYVEDADRFLEVTDSMADLTWTPEQHAWLSRFNRSARSATREGREELKKFEDAPILMDTRKMTASGEEIDDPDGADAANLKRLHEVAKKQNRAILKIGGYHDKPTDNPDVKTEFLPEDDFRRLADTLHLCEDARVLLTHNLWVEAGLMNGALGTVRGFIWPKGGDPTSTESKKRAPLCVVVEFDEVNMPMEQKVDEHGQPVFDDAKQPVMERVRFFPDIPGTERCVPIFREEASDSGSGVTRRQFPLTLAWALTHWKAQGMTLSRVRIRLGDKIASTVGMGYVAVTRVKHPWDIVFDTDLPSYDTFMKAQSKPVFRARQRFVLRLEAKSSRTLRRYGFCEADPWTLEDAELADLLLRHLEGKAATEREALGMAGDHDAWPWKNEEPPVARFMAAAVHEVGGEEPHRRERAMRVAERLQAPTAFDDGSEVYLHMPAVKEALGCLIPKWLHPRLDGRPLKGKAQPSDPAGGVHLEAGRWRVSMSDERDLFENKALKKTGLFEFFLVVLSHVAAELELPLVVASHKIGELFLAERDVDHLRAMLAAMSSWRACQERLVGGARELLLPLAAEGGGRECKLARISVAGEAEGGAVAESAKCGLSVAKLLRVSVYDRLVPGGGTSKKAEQLAQSFDGVLRGLGRFGGDAEVQLEQAEFPRCDSDIDVFLTVLGLILSRTCAWAGEAFPDVAAAGFGDRVRTGLRLAFGFLRAGAGRSGETNVLLQLRSAPACREFLRLFSGAAVCAVPSEPSGGCNVRRVEASEEQFVKALTWNVCGDGLSAAAPPTWAVADKRAALRRDLNRWDESIGLDIVALQECTSEARLAEVPSRLAFVGSAASHAGFVHLYVREGFAYQMIRCESDLPCVAASVTIGDVVVNVVAVHLAPHSGAQAVRVKQLRSALAGCDAGGVLVMGDANMREEEALEARESLSLREALYAGYSWDQKRNRFFAAQQDSQESFDRVFFRGAVFAQAFLVGQSREFMDGRGFCLSDHYGVLSVVDADKAHGGGDEKRSGERKLAVTERRNTACAAEQSCVVELERKRAHADKAQQQARLEQEMDEGYAAGKRAREAAREHRLALRKAAFGAGSFFAPDAEKLFRGQKPVSAADVAIEAYAGLPGVGGKRAWEGELVRGGYPPLGGFGGKFGSYAGAVAQLLLRTPAVALWLERHAQVCSVARGCDAGECVDAPPPPKKCLPCSVRESRRQLGKRGEVPALWRAAGVAGATYLDRMREHDVVAFLKDVLRAMHDAEVSAARAAPWLGMALDHGGARMVTHVDRLFSFLVEICSQCGLCGERRRDFAAERVLDLVQAMPEDVSAPVCVTELYLRACAPKLDCRRCPVAGCGGGLREQRRVASLPNVLLVQVGAGLVGKGFVRVEMQISFPGLGHMVLAGVVYRIGEGDQKARFLCASPGPEGYFWCFDGLRHPWRPGQEIAQVLPRSAVCLLYARPAGTAVFAGMAEAASGPAAPVASAGPPRMLRQTPSAESMFAKGTSNAAVVGGGEMLQGTPPRVRRFLREDRESRAAAAPEQAAPPWGVRRKLSESGGGVGGVSAEEPVLAAADVPQLPPAEHDGGEISCDAVAPVAPAVGVGVPALPPAGSSDATRPVAPATPAPDELPRWARFTLECDRSTERCQARQWGGRQGLGTQCSGTRSAPEDLCARHVKELALRAVQGGEMRCPAHGFVYDDIPNDKYAAFLKAGTTRKRRVQPDAGHEAGSMSGGVAGALGGDRPREDEVQSESVGGSADVSKRARVGDAPCEAGVAEGLAKRALHADAAQLRADAVPPAEEAMKRRRKEKSAALAVDVSRRGAALPTEGVGGEAARSDQGTGARGSGDDVPLGAPGDAVGECTRAAHICHEDSRLGCSACAKTCHRDATDPRCPFFGQQRGQLGWVPNESDRQDTLMFRQDLGGNLPHRTQFQWQRLGMDPGSGDRAVRLDDGCYFLARASGENCNCLIHSLRQCLNLVVNVDAVRRSLQREFSDPCGAGCDRTGRRCARGCMKVYADNFLSTDHWKAVLKYIGEFAWTGRIDFDAEQFCLRVIDLTWAAHGVVEGNPAGRRLTVARENGNHFIPVLPYRVDVGGIQWNPW